MKRIPLAVPRLSLFWLGACLTAVTFGARADDGGQQLNRGTGATAFAAGPDSSEHRKYAPDREMDVLHLAIDVTPDFDQRTIRGQVNLKFKPIAKPLTQVQLDAEKLGITQVTASEPIRGWQNDDSRLVVTLAQPLPTDREATVTVTYQAAPREGLYFRTPAMGYREGETHLFTQGETTGHRHWYPGYDAPNEKFTSEVICRVPEGMTVISNGRLMGETKDASTGLVAVRWLQDKPHANYLVALVAGYFRKLEDTYRDIPLTFYTLPSATDEAPNSFRGTREMMAFFEEEIGVPYPWAKYAQVCVNDFVAGGMENTTLTILTDGTLFPAATENLRSSQGLVAHELVHQWFGDLVTCKDWSHLWLNEGFATYYEALFEAHQHGRDAFLYQMYNEARGIFDNPGDQQPMVYRRYDSPDEQFSYRNYAKGGWVLHMLRSQLGEDLYRRCIRTFLERHAYGTAVTQDLNAVIEELSGRSFDPFFDQWVYHARFPELDVSYAWDENTRLARVSVKQTQPLSDQVLLYRLPLPVRFKGRSGVTDRTLSVKEKEEDFYVALPEAPEVVRVDPDLTLLARIRFNPPQAMVQAMADDASDALGRLFAVAQFSNRKDPAAIATLRRLLNEDAFYGVRLEAAKALRSIHTDEALEALLASTAQSDARVRHQVQDCLGGFYRESVLAAARKTVAEEKNPDIVAVALRTIGRYPSPDNRAAITSYLNSDSYRNGLADAAVDAARSQGDPALIPVLLDTLQQRERRFTTDGFAEGLRVLAYLARHEDAPSTVREFLSRYVNHPRRNVQLAAIQALGALGDPQAIPILETFTRAAARSPERQAADRAIGDLRARRKPADELGDLRREVLELQQANRELKQSLETLRKRLDEIAPSRPTEPEKERETKKKKKSVALGPRMDHGAPGKRPDEPADPTAGARAG